MASPILRLGVVGLGRAAASMLPSLLAHPNVRVVAAADPNPIALRRFEEEIGGTTFASGEALCESPAVDAVYIAAPHQFHAPLAIAAARHGKHIILEKPIALTLGECADITDAVDRAGVKLVVGHTHGFDPAISAMRRVIEEGELGRLRLMTNLTYTNFLYRPRRPEELDTSLGGGILYNQVQHQIEIVRALDRSQVRTVKAVTGIWDPKRPTEGAMSAFLEFSDGAAATLSYSGYDRFDSDELHFWVGESGGEKAPNHAATRRALATASPEQEPELRARSGFSGSGAVRMPAQGKAHQPHFGFLLVSCEHGDMRPSPDGILIYDSSGKREVGLPPGRAYPNKDAVIDELYDTVLHDRAPLHDARWATVTLAVTLAIMQSAQEGREIVMTTQAEAFAG